MADRLKVKVTRALMLDGRIVPEGAVLTLAATDAADCLDSGRAVLLDPADLAAAAAARRGEVNALLKQQARLAPNPGSPWQSVEYFH